MGIIQNWINAAVKSSQAYKDLEESAADQIRTYLETYGLLALGSTDREFDQSLRDEVSRQAWNQYRDNPMAANFVNALNAFVFGPGFAVSHEDPKADAEIQDYIDADDFYTTASEEFNRYLLDGITYNFIYFDTLTGDMAVREIDPLEIKSVIPDEHDYKKIIGIYREYTRTTWDRTGQQVGSYIEKEFIEHDQRLDEQGFPFALRDFLVWRRPTLSNNQYGLSFLAPVLYYLALYKRVIDVGVKQQLAATSFAWDVEVDEVDDKKVKAYRAKLIERGAPKPGSFLVHNKQVKYTPMAPRLSPGRSDLMARLISLLITAGTGVPEFIVTGDASNANYASTSVALDAFKKNVQKLQYDVRSGFIVPLFRRFLVQKVKARRCTPAAAEIPVKVNYPDILPQDLKELKEFLQFLKANDLITDETVLNLAPYDLDAKAELDGVEKQKDAKIEKYGGFPFAHPAPTTEPADEEPEADTEEGRLF